MLLSGNHSYSLTAITYQMQASQWAASVKENISNVSIMAVCCEYRSIFCNRRASRRRRVNFTRWMCESCVEHKEKKVHKKGTYSQMTHFKVVKMQAYSDEVPRLFRVTNCPLVWFVFCSRIFPPAHLHVSFFFFFVLPTPCCLLFRAFKCTHLAASLLFRPFQFLLYSFDLPRVRTKKSQKIVNFPEPAWLR